MSIASKTATIRPDFTMACRRYPVPVLAAALITGWYLADLRLIHFEFNSPLDGKHGPPAMLFAFFAATAAGIATTRYPSWMSWLVQAPAFLAGIGVGLWMEIERGTVLPVLIALICAVSLAAGMAARHGAAGYWLANARLTASLVACLVAAGIVTLGGAIALYSAESLFDLKVRRLDDTLAIGLWVFVLPVSWLALARFDDADPTVLRGNVLLRILALVTDGLLIPLVLLLGTIIHLYAALIAANGELPKGQIGWIVPVYLVTGYGVFLLAQGPETQLPRLRRWFLRAFLAGTVAPLILLGLAVAVRIEAYGVTEDRYFLALMVGCGALLAGSVLIRRPFDIRLVPLVTGALALVASFGPLSAHTMTIRSQAARAYAILASVSPERWAAAKDGGLSEQQKESLISAVRHLRNRNWSDFEALSSVWPSHLPKEAWELRQAFMETGQKEAIIHFIEPEVTRLETITLIEKFDLYWNAGSQTVQGDSLKLELLADGHFLKVLGDSGMITRFDLSSLLAMEPSRNIKFSDARERNRELKSVEGQRGDLIVSRFVWSRGPDGRIPVSLKGKIILY